MFNVGDFIGRSLPRFDALVIISPKYLWIASLARIVFVPAFLFCHEPHWIRFDLAVIGIMAAFSLTNGYIGECIICSLSFSLIGLQALWQ